MDILAHGLWATAAAESANAKLTKPLRLRWVALWGVFPDLFAFGSQFVVRTWYRYWSDVPVPRPSHGPLMGDDLQFFLRSAELYKFSHSLVIFVAVFALVWIIRRRPSWVLLAWGLHILMDIPTHTSRFYATPFLWPLSSYRFSGISWGRRWFMILNYGTLSVVYLYLLLRRIRMRMAWKPAPRHQEHVQR